MESQINASDFYTENKALGVDRNPRIDGVSPPVSKNFFVVAWILRLLAICATLVAAIVMGANKQTAMVAIQVPPDPFGAIFITPASAKYYYSPAFIFFVVANAVACGYTVLSLIPGGRLAFKSGGYSLKPAFLVAMADLVMVALVSSGASAAAAIAYVGYKGNSHTQWLKICDNFGRFCHQTAGAIVTSFVGVIIFMILTVMSIYGIYKHSSRAR